MRDATAGAARRPAIAVGPARQTRAALPVVAGLRVEVSVAAAPPVAAVQVMAGLLVAVRVMVMIRGGRVVLDAGS